MIDRKNEFSEFKTFKSSNAAKTKTKTALKSEVKDTGVLIENQFSTQYVKKLKSNSKERVNKHIKMYRNDEETKKLETQNVKFYNK